MENTNLKQIEEIVKALAEDLKEIPTQVQILKNIIDKKNNHERTPLLKLMGRLTKTSRRHNAEKKYNNYTIATNHQGLGYEGKWSSQLTPLCSSHNDEEETLRGILLDDEIVIDIISNIKKSHQKTFLKTIKVLKKHRIKKSLKESKNKILNNMECEIPNTNYKISINTNRSYSLTLSLRQKDNHEEIFVLDIPTNYEGDLKSLIEEEKHEILKTFSTKTIKKMDINDIKSGYFILKYKQNIIDIIKLKQKELTKTAIENDKETKELNEILEPLLALENL